MGQLGPRCALWEDTKPEGRWKPVDLLGPLGLSHEDWEPVKVAVTWTTSFVVYRKLKDDAVRGASAAAPSEGVREIVVSCGSNDFGELGVDDPGREGHIPTSRASAKPTIIELGLDKGDAVEVIKGGQRHVLAVIADARGKQRLIGWGAARRGELDPSTAADAASSSTSAGGGRASGSMGYKGKGSDTTGIAPSNYHRATDRGRTTYRRYRSRCFSFSGPLLGRTGHWMGQQREGSDHRLALRFTRCRSRRDMGRNLRPHLLRRTVVPRPEHPFAASPHWREPPWQIRAAGGMERGPTRRWIGTHLGACYFGWRRCGRTLCGRVERAWESRTRRHGR
jgi:hypothetical protein